MTARSQIEQLPRFWCTSLEAPAAGARQVVELSAVLAILSAGEGAPQESGTMTTTAPVRLPIPPLVCEKCGHSIDGPNPNSPIAGGMLTSLSTCQKCGGQMWQTVTAMAGTTFTTMASGDGSLAQSVERQPFKLEDAGSTPRTTHQPSRGEGAPAEAPTGWQPIATAEKREGHKVLGINDECAADGPFIAEYSEWDFSAMPLAELEGRVQKPWQFAGWISDMGEPWDPQPTHWIALPDWPSALVGSTPSDYRRRCT